MDISYEILGHLRWSDSQKIIWHHIFVSRNLELTMPIIRQNLILANVYGTLEQWHAQRWQKNVTYTHNDTYSTLGDDETIDFIDPIVAALVEDISLKLTGNKSGAWYGLKDLDYLPLISIKSEQHFSPLSEGINLKGESLPWQI